MDFQAILERLREMFPATYKSDIEEFIVSKNPQSTADVEHWMKEYTYHHRNWTINV